LINIFPKKYIFKSENVRLNATIKISVKNNETGECHKIELVRFPFPSRKFMLRFDGKVSCQRLRSIVYASLPKDAKALDGDGEAKILHEKSLNYPVLSMVNCDRKCIFCRRINVSVFQDRKFGA